MRTTKAPGVILAAAAALLWSAAVRAEDRCSAKGSMGGKAFAMTHCAAAVYDSEKSVSLWFSENPIPAEEIETFHLSSYPKDRGPDNKPRTTLALGFCPGGGKAAASPGEVKTVEFNLTDASNPMVSQTWLFELPKDKDLKFEKLSGEVKPGGKLTGRASGKKKRDDGTLYDWQIDFDVTLPARAAGGGMGCGS
jgi:hypothetical protein